MVTVCVFILSLEFPASSVLGHIFCEYMYEVSHMESLSISLSLSA